MKLFCVLLKYGVKNEQKSHLELQSQKVMIFYRHFKISSDPLNMLHLFLIVFNDTTLEYFLASSGAHFLKTALCK